MAKVIMGIIGIVLVLLAFAFAVMVVFMRPVSAEIRGVTFNSPTPSSVTFSLDTNCPAGQVMQNISNNNAQCVPMSSSSSNSSFNQSLTDMLYPSKSMANISGTITPNHLVYASGNNVLKNVNHVYEMDIGVIGWNAGGNYLYLDVPATGSGLTGANSRWEMYYPGESNMNIGDYGYFYDPEITTRINLLVSGDIKTDNNISAQNFIGSGKYITDIPTNNVTYNNLLFQNCGAGKVVNGTYANGTFICTTVSSSSDYSPFTNDSTKIMPKDQSKNIWLKNDTDLDFNDATVLEFGTSSASYYNGVPFGFYWSNPDTNNGRLEFRQQDGGNAQLYAYQLSASYLYGDGSSISNILPENIAGYPDNAAQYLDGSGSWSTPASGGMNYTNVAMLNGSATTGSQTFNGKQIFNNGISIRNTTAVDNGSIDIYTITDGWGGGTGSYITPSVNGYYFYMGSASKKIALLDWKYTTGFTNTPASMIQISASNPSGYCLGRTCSAIGNTGGDVVISTGAAGYITPIHQTDAVTTSLAFKTYVNGSTQAPYALLGSGYVFDTNATVITGGNMNQSTWAVAGSRIATLDMLGNLNINGNFTSNNKKGITVSGTTCTITEITGGLITGATCV